MEAEDEIFFIRSDLAAFNGEAEIIHPAEATTLPASEKPGTLRERAPPSFAFFVDVIGEEFVFLRRPWAPLQPYFAAARSGLGGCCGCGGFGGWSRPGGRRRWVSHGGDFVDLRWRD